jgi:hypothetical protein
LVHLVIDTCVWLDIALDKRLAPLLDVLEHALMSNQIQVVVPDFVITELERNADSVQERTRKAFEAMVRDALDAAAVLPSDAERDDLRRLLTSVSNNLPSYQAELNTRIGRIRALMKGPQVLRHSASDRMMAAALKAGLEKKAPYHRGKNSCGDALLIQHFVTYVTTVPSGDQVVLITSNKTDFSDPNDHRRPHADIAGIFDGTTRLFSINIAEHLRALDNAVVTPAVVEAAGEASERSMAACPSGGEHEFDPKGGAFLRSTYGGLTWHLFCRKCGAKIDTGDFYE